jgi:adenylate cyclase
MAVFGVPRPAGDDEDRALRAALAMIEALAGWNRVRRRQRLEPIEIRIGINSDRVFWGGIGAPQRRDVTVIGEGVNLAARLERACKHYHARILISGGTRRRLQGRYRLRLADHLLLPGESRPTTVYEVLDYHSERSFPQMAAVLRHYRRGLACIRGRRFADAVRAFDQALALNPQDPLAQLHRSRCLACLERPPVAL